MPFYWTLLSFFVIPHAYPYFPKISSGRWTNRIWLFNTLLIILNGTFLMTLTDRIWLFNTLLIILNGTFLMTSTDVCNLTLNEFCHALIQPKAHPEPSQKSKIKLFVKIVNYWKSLTIFAKSSILGVWLVSE